MITPTPLHILVIDDHSENRQVARWMLTQAFCETEILEAESIEQAVEVWDTRRLDCVLLDSAISSFESAVVQLSQKHQTTGIPLVLLVSVQDELQRRMGIEQGVENWLVKETLSAQNIEMIVRKAMEISSLRLMLEEQGRELDRLRNELSVAALTPPPLPSTGLITDACKSPAASEAKQVDTATGSDSRKPPATSAPIEVSAEQRSGTQLVRPMLVTNGFGTPTAKEDELARQIQADLFPPGSPFVDGYDIAGLSIPAEKTGGDYYDYLPTADGLLTITIGECSGHGLAPAMFMASLRAYLRVLVTSAIDASDVVSRANTLITEDIGEEEFLVTLMLVQVDQLTRSVQYSSAGHQGHLIKCDGSTEVLPSTGMPMGLRTETVIPDGTTRKLHPGDLLLLTTDGVQKMTSVSGEKFGTDRMLNVVLENRELPARIIANYLRNACVEFADPQPQRDDMTIVIVKASVDEL
jgi:serine phosphatase RsbU (regulator of sigma subunit)/DNA-binding NarL/FixJ family response regulator